MSTRVDVEEIEVTRGQRLLTVLLAGFLLLGGLWSYGQLDRTDDRPSFSEPLAEPTPAQRSVLDRRDETSGMAVNAANLVRVRRQALTDRREAYRTALDEGRRDPGLARRYREAQRRYTAAQALARRRDAQSQAAETAAQRVDAALHRLVEARVKQIEDQRRHNRRITVGLRLALVIGLLVAALRLMVWQRRRRSRWALTGYAGVGAAGALALIMGLDYLTDWIDFVALGPLALAIAGAAITLVALGALQRHLTRRLPGRRVRRGECPFCGYPARGGEHCEGCGRSVIAPCAQCHAARRVGTAHCAACGQT